MPKENKEGQMSLREVLVLAREYLREYLRYWWLIGLVVLVAGLTTGYINYTKPAPYFADVTFIVNQENSSKGGLGNILGQFGLGGGGGGGEVNINRLLAMAESQVIIQEVLLDSVEIDGQRGIMGNFLVEEYDLDERWKLVDSVRLAHQLPGEMSPREVQLLRSLHQFVVKGKEGVLQFSHDEATGFIHVKSLATNEQLCYLLSKNTYEKLSAFYIEENVGSSRRSVEMLRFKGDSLQAALKAAEYRLADLQDTKLMIMRERDRLKQVELSRQVQLLSLAYGEVIRNLETASFALSTKTPYFKLINRPLLPLVQLYPPALKNTILGFLVGGIITIFLLTVRKFLLDVLKKDA
jgi:hypothetical protein